MLFSRRGRSQNVDAITRRLADDMRWLANGRNATVWLYAELEVASLAGVTVVRWHDGKVIARPLRSQAEALIRNLWSEFRLAGRDRWRAVVVRTDGPGQTSVSYIYDDLFDAMAGYDRRLRRWLVRTVPNAIGAVTPALTDESIGSDQAD